MLRGYALTIILVIGFISVAQATPTIEIIMEQTTYSYCDKLFYTIRVSEITGNPAIIHIRDSFGKNSSAIPIPITEYENPIPSRVPFTEDIFPLGDYFIDVEYGGEKTSTMFTLIDSGKTCLPGFLKTITVSWLSGDISDGLLIDAFDRHTDILNMPFNITENNIHDISIPEWVKNTAFWWIQESISDDEFIAAFQYMMNTGIISIPR